MAEQWTREMERAENVLRKHYVPSEEQAFKNGKRSRQSIDAIIRDIQDERAREQQ